MTKSWWENPVLRQFLLGIYDDKSALAVLRGKGHIVRAIVERLVASWRSYLDQRDPGYVRLEWLFQRFPSMEAEPPGPLFVDFPPPLTTDEGEPALFHVNMMPIVLGDSSSVPETCQRYVPMIEACLSCLYDPEDGKVGYLTIHEGYVEANTSQRRSGLHVEMHGVVGLANCVQESCWGGGYRCLVSNELFGGIFMASTVADSCGIWNVRVDRPQEIMGPLGSMEHMRIVLDEETHGYTTLAANELIWMTDTTLHESLPLATRQYRQYFRLVTSNVSHWFAAHSTPNPLGIQPACTIVEGDKFGEHVTFDHKCAPHAISN